MKKKVEFEDVIKGNKPNRLQINTGDDQTDYIDRYNKSELAGLDSPRFG